MQANDQPRAAGDRDDPGRRPAEIQPNQGDFDQADRTPPEIAPAGEDIDQPDTAPVETPAEPGQPDIVLPPD